jgi:hypothetical protein
MGILTDFFVANDRQLATVFSGWLRVADQPVERQVKNPFTGQMQVAREWPSTDPVGDGPLEDIPNIRVLPHAEWKNVDPVKVAKLHEILTGSSLRETLDELMRPALVHPSNDETSLHEFPRGLTDAIRAVSDDELQSAAENWQRTEEMQAHGFSADLCADVLRSLRGLAAACAPDQRLYLQWSL